MFLQLCARSAGAADGAHARWSAPAAGVLSVAAAAALAAAAAPAAHADAGPPASDPYQLPPPTGRVPKEVVLYQYEVCPYCCKVKAVLDYYKVPYRVVEVNPLTKKELKSWSTYKKVPVIQLDDGSVVNESSAIISRLAAEMAAAGRAPGAGGSAGHSSSSGGSWFGGSKGAAGGKGSEAAAGEEEARWRKWVDDRFVKTVTANIYRSWDEAWQTFTYITNETNWSWGTQQLARSSGAVLMWQIGKRMPKKYGLEGDIREVLYRDVREFTQALKGRDFLGGGEPNLADLAVFGVLRAIQGTDTYRDVLANTDIGPWVVRMINAVGPSARIADGSTQNAPAAA